MNTPSIEYVKSLEEQNEALKKKLAESEINNEKLEQLRSNVRVKSFKVIDSTLGETGVMQVLPNGQMTQISSGMRYDTTIEMDLTYATQDQFNDFIALINKKETK